jgi:hypothetical protein
MPEDPLGVKGWTYKKIPFSTRLRPAYEASKEAPAVDFRAYNRYQFLLCQGTPPAKDPMMSDDDIRAIPHPLFRDPDYFFGIVFTNDYVHRWYYLNYGRLMHQLTIGGTYNIVEEAADICMLQQDNAVCYGIWKLLNIQISSALTSCTTVWYAIQSTFIRSMKQFNIAWISTTNSCSQLMPPTSPSTFIGLLNGIALHSNLSITHTSMAGKTNTPITSMSQGCECEQTLKPNSVR